MKRKYTVIAVVAITLALAGVVWSQSGPSTYSLRVSPGGSTACSSVELLAPPFYQCTNMEVVNVSGVQVGTVDWGYTRGTLLLTLERSGEVTNYAIPAMQSLTSGSNAYPECSAEWTIQTRTSDLPQVVLHLSEYRSGGGRVPEGCRASWDEGTIVQ